MIILTEIAENQVVPAMISNGEAVWWYSFGGDEFYTDDHGVTFYWAGRREITDIRSVRFGTEAYLEVHSVADCRITAPSFFWDEPNLRLYVHHTDNENGFSRTSDSFVMGISAAGYATGQLTGQPQYFPDIFFDPIITNIGGLRKQVDPLKFGLLSFESSSFDLINAEGKFDAIDDLQAYNAQIIFVLMRAGQRDIDNGIRIFSGYTGGVQYNDDSMGLQLSEARSFYNRSVCPSLFDIATYPSLDPKFENKRVPVAYGKIGRGICVPVDSVGIETPDAATITFKLADETIHEILAVTALYDSNGDSVTLGTIDLVNCTVQYSKPADKEVDLAQFTWEGQGYDIPGDYNNGIDIMQDVFAEQGQIGFTVSRFDVAAWNEARAENTQSCGISVQTERGLIEEIIQPVTVSLQGLVDILGDGRISYRSRDVNAPIGRFIHQYQILAGPDKAIDPEAVVSSIVVNYAPDFSGSGNALSVVFDDQEVPVVSKYGVRRTKPVSPVETILTEAADALALGAGLATTTANPENMYSVEVPLDDVQTELLDIVQVNIGRPGEEDWRVTEVLSKTLAFSGNQLRYTFELRELDRAPEFPPEFYEDIIDALYSDDLGLPVIDSPSTPPDVDLNIFTEADDELLTEASDELLVDFALGPVDEIGLIDGGGSI